MGLDYSWTCGTIDGNIESFKQAVEENLEQMLDECSPLLQGETKKEFVKEWVNYIYNDSECIFENLRECNSNMRSEADNQIDNLESEKQKLENDIETKQEQVDDLEEKIEELEKSIRLYER